jgi:hypothetical protein
MGNETKTINFPDEDKTGANDSMNTDTSAYSLSDEERNYD